MGSMKSLSLEIKWRMIEKDTNTDLCHSQAHLPMCMGTNTHNERTKPCLWLVGASDPLKLRINHIGNKFLAIIHQTIQYNNNLYCTTYYIQSRDNSKHTGYAWAVCNEDTISHKGREHPQVLLSVILTPIPELAEGLLHKQPKPDTSE